MRAVPKVIPPVDNWSRRITCPAPNAADPPPLLATAIDKVDGFPKLTLQPALLVLMAVRSAAAVPDPGRA